jgi:hypothetical protein
LIAIKKIWFNYRLLCWIKEGIPKVTWITLVQENFLIYSERIIDECCILWTWIAGWIL